MGSGWRGALLMSGIGQLMIIGTTPAPAMTASAGVSGGSVPVNVSTASGTTDALPQGGFRRFVAGVSGGVPPYEYRWTRQNGENKTVLVNASSQTAYVEWSGMIVGEYWSTTARCRVTDSTGASATSGTIVIGLQRTA
jgi:hypothetical protein